MKEAKVTITNRRYEELLDTETRVSVFIEQVKEDCFISIETALSILGYPHIAKYINDEREKNLELYENGVKPDED